MNFHIGTSGWSYKEWKGSFYPPKIRPDEMLPYYAARFSTVEVNNSFYRIPSDRVLASWAGLVPPRISLRHEGLPSNNPQRSSQE